MVCEGIFTNIGAKASGLDTLPALSGTVYHQYGHCKFGEKCYLFHNPHICINPQFDKSLCSLRNPRPCIYYIHFGYCKFESHCSFLHSTEKEIKGEEDIKDLKQILQNVPAGKGI